MEEPLAHIALDLRQRWVDVLTTRALDAGAPRAVAWAAARAAERAAYGGRCVATRLGESPACPDGARAWIYGDAVLLGAEQPCVHEAAAAEAYAAAAARAASLLPALVKSGRLGDADAAAGGAWLVMADEEVAAGTEHGAWRAAFDTAEAALQSMLATARAPPDRTGLYECTKCKADMSIDLRQTRSADEGMSVLLQCTRCGTRRKLG